MLVCSERKNNSEGHTLDGRLVRNTLSNIREWIAVKIRRPRRGHQACGNIFVSRVLFGCCVGYSWHPPSSMVFQSDMPQNPWNVYFLETKSPCGVAPNTEEGLRIYPNKINSFIQKSGKVSKTSPTLEFLRAKTKLAWDKFSFAAWKTKLHLLKFSFMGWKPPELQMPILCSARNHTRAAFSSPGSKKQTNITS